MFGKLLSGVGDVMGAAMSPLTALSPSQQLFKRTNKPRELSEEFKNKFPEVGTDPSNMERQRVQAQSLRR